VGLLGLWVSTSHATPAHVPPPEPFDPFDGRLRTLELEIDPSDMVAWDADTRVYVPATLRLGGHTLRDVHARLKGNSSLRPVWDKPALKVDLDRTVSDRTLGGVKGLLLHNAVFDCSALREALAADVLQQLGLPSQRTTHVWVRINRVDKGLYVLTEPQDDLWLQRHVDDPTGNLYDGKFDRLGPGHPPTKSDLVPHQVDNFQLEEGTDVGKADLIPVSDALDDLTVPLTTAAVDWPQVRRSLAAEEWLGQWDGYGRNRNNYRVYVEPSSGLVQLILTDFDKAFRTDKGADWLAWEGNEGERGILSERCLDNPSCEALYLQELAAVDAAIDEAALLQRIAEARSTLTQLLEADPFHEGCQMPSTWFDDLEQWVAERSVYVEERVAP
jgi:spore coat protein CotH